MRLPTQFSRTGKNVHKGTFGHLLVLAGSQTMMGAGSLVSLSAMRSGVGLVTWGIPNSLNDVAQSKADPVIMTLPLKETNKKTISLQAFEDLDLIWDKYNAIVIGPGLSVHSSTKNFVQKVIQKTTIPMIIDGDALTAVSENNDILLKNKTPKIITPHPGEMARLTKLSVEGVQSRRESIAKEYAGKYQCVVVLKGHQTIVADGKNLYVNDTGNPGMATAGCGDVLAGMIGAFSVQGLSPFDAAKYGVYFHGKAGDLAAEKYGKVSMLASDILQFIGNVLNPVKSSD